MSKSKVKELGKRKLNVIVYLHPDMLYSEAFTSLTKTSMRVLFRFLQKRKWDKKKGRTYYRYEDYENGGLSFPYSEAKALGITEASFLRAIDQLIELGFIEQEWQGGAFGNRGDYSRFKYIEDWKDYGTDTFKPRERKKRVIKSSKGLEKYNKKRISTQSKLTVVHSQK